jgi:hypothetical protein
MSFRPVRCGVLLSAWFSIAACAPEESMNSMRDGSAFEASASDASLTDRQLDRDSATTEVAFDGSNASDASDVSNGPASARWFEGEYRQIFGFNANRSSSEPYGSFRVWTDSNGQGRVLESPSLGSPIPGTWRALSPRAVEVRFNDGSTLVVDESSMRANCDLLRMRSRLWIRWSNATTACPFARPLSDRECSLAERSISWSEGGVGSPSHNLVLRESGAGFYYRMSTILDCDHLGCGYHLMVGAQEYFEWRIEDDRLVGPPVRFPATFETRLRRLPMCRRGQVYGTPTNLEGERCGDGICRRFEWSGDCPQDCGYQSGQSCPLGSRCERSDEICAPNGVMAAEGTCRPSCTADDERCSTACCGSYSGSPPYACFPATECSSDAPTCKGYDVVCEHNSECCIVGGRASTCVVGLNPRNPNEGRCRPNCFRDSDCGVGKTCSCRLDNGQRVCGQANGC